jgi:excisionase family DNA binding protein
MSQIKKKEPKLLTLKQASELLNCHPNTLRNWDDNGYLVAVRFGTRRDRRYRREDVMKLLVKEKNAENK